MLVQFIITYSRMTVVNKIHINALQEQMKYRDVCYHSVQDLSRSNLISKILMMEMCRDVSLLVHMDEKFCFSP